MRNKILIIIGDPESINSEIIFKSWKRLSKQVKKHLLNWKPKTTPRSI